MTPKEEKFIQLFKENAVRIGKRKTLYDLLLESGYSRFVAAVPKSIFRQKAVKEGLKQFIKDLDDKRKQAITHITDNKLEQAPARELAYVIDILTKNHQLLTGGATDRGETIEINEDKYEDILERETIRLKRSR